APGCQDASLSWLRVWQQKLSLAKHFSSLVADQTLAMPGAASLLRDSHALADGHSAEDLTLLLAPAPKARGAGFFVEAPSSFEPTSFGGHGHGAAPSNPDEALAQAKAGLKTCALGFMASSAALLSAYVTWSLEKKHFEHEVHEVSGRKGTSVSSARSKSRSRLAFVSLSTTSVTATARGTRCKCAEEIREALPWKRIQFN
ncbi:unnamed protein product, partial [Effrenium voratum]